MQPNVGNIDRARWARRCVVLTAGVLVAAGFAGSVPMLAHEIAQSLPSLPFKDERKSHEQPM